MEFTTSGTPAELGSIRPNSEVRTTMRYGDAFTSDMAEAHGKIVGLAMNGTGKRHRGRMMRHGDIRVTISYGDAIGQGLREASARVAARDIPQ